MAKKKAKPKTKTAKKSSKKKEPKVPKPKKIEKIDALSLIPVQDEEETEEEPKKDDYPGVEEFIVKDEDEDIDDTESEGGESDAYHDEDF